MSPLAVMCPLNVCVSEISSPNIFEPLVITVDDVMFDEVTCVMFAEVAIILVTLNVSVDELKVKLASAPKLPLLLNWTCPFEPATVPLPPPLPADVCIVPSAKTSLSTPPILKFLSLVWYYFMKAFS